MEIVRETIVLSSDEHTRLKQAASQACRRPKDHARYLVLSALGLTRDNEPCTEMNGAADQVLVDHSSAISASA